MATAVFSPEQIAALSAPLDRAKVQTRSQAGRSLAYMEGWQVIAEANRIFGFDGWQRQTLATCCVSQAERPVGRDQKPGWGVTYTCRVRITVGASSASPVVREGCGAGHGIDVDLGQAHESALKEAETDAMKRALMTFGNPFGLAHYDKQQREVTSSTAPTSVRLTPPQRNGDAAEPTAEVGLEPLDPATIQQILEQFGACLARRWRASPRPSASAFRCRPMPPRSPIGSVSGST